MTLEVIPPDKNTTIDLTKTPHNQDTLKTPHKDTNLIKTTYDIKERSEGNDQGSSVPFIPRLTHDKEHQSHDTLLIGLLAIGLTVRG